MRKESEDIQPVIERHGHDASGGEALAIVARLRTVAGNESTAIEVHQYRQLRVGGFRQCPDVEVKAILAHTIRTEVHIAEDRALWAARPELIGFTHAGPVLPRRGV